MRNLVPALLALILTGCGLSPQVIEIAPSPAPSSENMGNNQPVAVRVVDQREHTQFGTRGGVYSETSLIRPANDVPQAVTEVLKKALQSRGYNAFNPGDDSRKLEVRITTLEYIPEAGHVINEVRVNARLKAVANNTDGDTYTGVYRTSSDFNQPLTPTARQNERMINEVLERALDKLLADPALHEFLARP
jgi:uncharacterized lipoprotein